MDVLVEECGIGRGWPLGDSNGSKTIPAFEPAACSSSGRYSPLGPSRRLEPGGERALVAFGGPAHRRPGITDDVAVPPGAVNAVELEWFDRSHDPVHLLCRKRDVVRVAVHEGDPAPVLRHLRHVAGEEGATAFCPSLPVQHGATVEMAPDADQSHAVP